MRVINGLARLASLREAVRVIRGLANGEAVDYKGAQLRLPWATESRLPVRVAAYGPKALAVAGEMADGFILQLADPDIAAWSIAAVRKAAAAPRDPGDVKVCVAARLTSPAARRNSWLTRGTSAAGSAAWSKSRRRHRCPLRQRRDRGAKGAQRLHRRAAAGL